MFLFMFVFEAIFKVKVILEFHKIFLHKVHVFLGVSHRICMDLVAPLIFFNLYSLFLGVFMEY
jgi:hypothetical protein